MASSTSALMIRNFYWDRFYKVLCNDLLKKKMTIYMFLVKLEIIKLLTLLLGHGEIVRKGVSVRLNFQTTSSDTWHSILFYWPTVSLSVVDTKTKKWTAHMRENYKGQRFLHFLIMTHIEGKQYGLPASASFQDLFTLWFNVAHNITTVSYLTITTMQALNGQLSARQRNAIRMAFLRWRADSDPKLYAGSRLTGAKWIHISVIHWQFQWYRVKCLRKNVASPDSNSAPARNPCRPRYKQFDSTLSARHFFTRIGTSYLWHSRYFLILFTALNSVGPWA